ncbi:MAG: DUF4384 domain-containing protein [Bryobacteraceae bacterium]
MRYCICLAVAALLAPAAGAQGLTARELFYRDDGATPAAKPPAKTPTRRTTTRAKAAPKPPREAVPRHDTVEKQAVQIAVEGSPKVTAPNASVPDPRPEVTTPDGSLVKTASATHFGVRYNVVQVTDRNSKARKPVDPETAFHAGDCVGVELMSNRDGFLYVFNKASSGAWQVLLPSSEMPDQANTVRRGETQVVPGSYCFEFDNNAGTEKLLVVLTEREEDARGLGDAIRESGGAPEPKAPMVLALNRRIEMLREGQLIGRDIKIAKIGEPQAAGEPAHAVYAVRASTGPSERLVLEIDLRHE